MENPNYKKLIRVLEEIFQLNQADLDFGIYRIMNHKRTEIVQFLEHDLIPQVKAILTDNLTGDKSSLQKELDDTIKQLRGLGVDPDTSSKVQELRQQLGGAADLEAEENTVFNRLANFFSRYYEGGDFVSLRRYKEGVYAIPYEGEEVKLHWANHDQYYIKTSEYLKNYAFKLSNGKSVKFVLSEANLEQNNNKAAKGMERRFALRPEQPLEVVGEELHLFFTYEPTDKGKKQSELMKAAFERIKTQIPADFQEVLVSNATTQTEKQKNRTLLEKHFKGYAARNTFDYFIHKNLGKFLNTELDFYIKNEVLHLDDINTRDTNFFVRQLSQVRALKEIGRKIIAFLEQLENFQKKLWLKKKFVVETQYCLTLDRVPESLYADIIANQAQLTEWKKLFHIQDITAPAAAQGKLFKNDQAQPVDYSEPLTLDFLKANPYLVLDTRFFSEDFKDALIASMDNLDEQLDGVLINSENFQALNLLQERYREQVKCVYIDPPYNSDASAIIYKNNYKNSSFLSLIQDRIQLSNQLLKNTGLLTIAIDDVEVAYLRIVLEELLYKEVGVAVVRSNPQSRKAKGKFSPVHEYALFYGKSDLSFPASIGHEENKNARYPKIDKKGRYAWMNFIRAGNADLRIDRPTLYYPIVVNDNDEIRIPEMDWNDTKGEYELQESIASNEQLVFPIKIIDNLVVEKRWQRGHVRVAKEYDEYRIRRDNDGNVIIDFKTRMDENALPVTWWNKKEYASSNYGAAQQKEFFLEKKFDFPKAQKLVEDAIRACGADDENSIVLDYFSGSGTTGDAVISMNREDDGKRKYILVEMGEYFDSVTKPRIQKVIYSKDWKDGKPVSREGSSHAFKYLRLESYEDALNNLTLQQTEAQKLVLQDHTDFREGYMLHYLLDTATKASLLDIGAFDNPFAYHLNVTRNNEMQQTRVDMVETFNYLLGLVVEKQSKIRGFRVVEGENLQGERLLVIWRTIAEKSNEDLDAFFQKMGYNTRDLEFDRIYVNGDNNLENLKVEGDRWKVVLIEEAFKGLMFGG